MIASMAAVGFAPTGSTSAPPPFIDDDVGEEPIPDEFVFEEGPALTIDAGQPHLAVVRTDRGDIEIELTTDAPAVVNSFAFLAGKGFYVGSTFFFVDREYVAQAGDPTCRVDAERICSGVGGPGYSLPVEESALPFEQWSIVAPVLGEGSDQVHGSQFRVLYQADPRADGREADFGTVFGRVVAGQEILQGIDRLVPCTIIDSPDCHEDLSAALVIEDVFITPL